MTLHNGISLWKMNANGKMAPVLCKCGSSHPIGGDGGKEASYFYDAFHGVYLCDGCGTEVTSALDIDD